MSAVQAVNSVLSGAQLPVQSLTEKPVGPSFAEVMKKAVSGSSGARDFDGTLAELARTKELILSGKSLGLNEIIRYQIQAGDVGLRVELLSKLADSLIATSRKLQSGQ